MHELQEMVERFIQSVAHGVQAPPAEQVEVACAVDHFQPTGAWQTGAASVGNFGSGA